MFCRCTSPGRLCRTLFLYPLPKLRCADKKAGPKSLHSYRSSIVSSSVRGGGGGPPIHYSVRLSVHRSVSYCARKKAISGILPFAGNPPSTRCPASRISGGYPLDLPLLLRFILLKADDKRNSSSSRNYKIRPPEIWKNFVKSPTQH